MKHKQLFKSVYTLILGIGISLSVSLLYAQEERSAIITPIKIGQKVPEEFWSYEHLFYINGDTIRRTLQEHRGKMLVLDFWSSGCVPCLLHQKEINYFKKAYPDKLAVVMVNSLGTREDYSRLKGYAEKGRFTRVGINNLVSIIEDSYLERLFPYRSYPTYFWINESGILQTQTFRNLLDREYVAPFILQTP